MKLLCVGVNEVHLRRLTNSRGIIIIIIKSGRPSTKQFPANCPYIAKQSVVSDYTCPLTYANESYGPRRLTYAKESYGTRRTVALALRVHA